MCWVGPGDEVIMPAYTYTASASVVQHVGATIVMVNSQRIMWRWTMRSWPQLSQSAPRLLCLWIWRSICADVNKIKEIVTRPEIQAKFTPKNDIQKLMGRIVVSNDCAHSFGASRHGKMAGEIADFSSFSFHAVKT